MNRPGRPLVTRAAVAVVAAAAVGVLATGAVDPRGWSPAGSVVAQQPGADQVDLGGQPSVLVCPPAPRLGEEVSGDDADEDFRAESRARTETVLRTADGPAAAAATLPADGTPSTPVGIEAVGGGSVVRADGSAPVVVQAEHAVLAGALALSAADDGDLAGVAASSCTRPAETGWLVGGGVEPGRSGRVVLSNPGTTTATVDLVVLTAQGPVSPPAAQDLAVPGGSSREVLLESLLPPEPVVAVGLTARGGAVAAHLVDTRIAGVRARGVEQVPLTQVGTSLTVPGVLPGPTTDAVLRLANPGTAPAAVGWQLLGPDGAVAQEDETVLTVPAGTVAEVPLAAVRRDVPEPAVLAVQVTADQPVAAAVGTTVGRPRGLADVAVAVPAALLDDTALLPLPEADRFGTALALAAGDRGGAVDVVGLDADGDPVGEPTQVRVEPSATTVLAPPPDSVTLRLRVRSGDVAASTLVWSRAPGDRAPELVSTVPALSPPPPPGSVSVAALPPDVLRAPVASAP